MIAQRGEAIRRVLTVRNWTEDGDICTVVCTCGGMASMDPDIKRPIPPYTTAKCQRSTCEKRWRIESVNATEESREGGAG